MPPAIPDGCLESTTYGTVNYGLIGLFLGISCAVLVNKLAQTAAVISGNSVMIAFAVAATVGIFFGFYPARKAARLNPIEALRYHWSTPTYMLAAL